MASYDDTAIVSGSIVRVNDGADSVPLKNWIVTLPASLSGYTEVNAVRTGKNLWNVNAITDTTNPNNATIVNNGNGTITVTTTTQQNVKTAQKLKDICPNIKVGETYFLNATTTGNQKIIYLHQAAVSWTYGTAKVITSQMLESDVSLYASGTNSTATISDLSLTYGSTATAYEAYEAPTTHTASLGRTIYGGAADIVTGEGSNGSILIDLSELTWNMDNDTRFRSRQTDYTGASGWSGNWQNTVSNRFVCENPATAFNNRSDYSFANIPQNYYNFDIKVPSGIFADATAFKTWLGNIDGNGTHAVVVIDRLNADTFTFTPVTIETSKGSNTFWSEQGDSEVTYYKDGYGFTSVTIHKETPDGEPVEETRKLHHIIYEGQVDVISGTGLIYRGESGTQYDPPEQISFTPIEIATDEGENTLYADEGDSAITYRKEIT